MDKDKIKVVLKEAIGKAFEEEALENRGSYCGDETINLMAESALTVLLAVDDVQTYLKNEGMLKD